MESVFEQIDQSFETYLNAFLSMVDGKTYLEAHTGIGRTDLIITVNNEEFVVEAKVYSDIVKFRKGKLQLAQYAKSLSLTSAIYLVFVESEVTNATVIEEENIVEDILIKTHLVPYNLDKDFWGWNNEEMWKYWGGIFLRTTLQK